MPKYKTVKVIDQENEKIVQAIEGKMTAELEADLVELGTDYTPVGPDREEILQRIIIPKHPTMHFAWVNRADTQYRHLGWKMLSFSDGGQNVKEVLSADEAEKTTGNVLCWRTKVLQEKFTEKDRARLIQSNRIARGETSQSQADAVNEALGGIKGVKASALKETD